MSTMPEYGKPWKRPAPSVAKSGLVTTNATLFVMSSVAPAMAKDVPSVAMKGLIRPKLIRAPLMKPRAVARPRPARNARTVGLSRPSPAAVAALIA